MGSDAIGRITIILIGAVFVIYGLYALLESRLNPNALGVVVALTSLVGGIGLMLNRRWSRFCIYVVSTTLIATWLGYVAILAARAWPYATSLESVISLVPGFLMLFVAAASSYLVKNHFRAKPTKTF
jgi:hypothetical protein